MKTFEELYEELKNEGKDELNVAWQNANEKAKKRKNKTLIVCLIVDVLMIITLLRILDRYSINLLFNIIMLTFPVLMIDSLIIMVINMIPNKEQSTYNEKYKKIVINKMMSNFYNNLEYFPQKQMPKYIYQLCYSTYDEYRSEDYMEAQIDNNNSIQMAEVSTVRIERYKDSEGKERTRRVLMFSGLFAKIVLDKSINSELKIMPDKAMTLDKGRLKMDSSEFEKHFDVKASDKIIGMQILTSDIMEELVQFENKTKMKFDIYIKENELYLRFHSGPMFEVGNLKNGVLDEKTTKEYFYMLNFTYNLSKKLINAINDVQI